MRPNEGVWGIDLTTNEPVFIPYSALDGETLRELWRPVGGFCFAGDDFLNLPLPEVPFYIKDWLPMQGKMIIYAPAKAGKSYLCLQIAATIAEGDLLFGSIPTNRGRVLYLQFELGQHVLQARMKATGRDYSDVFVATTFSLKLNREADKRLIHDAIAAVEPNVVIFDPVYKVIGGDENEATDFNTIFDFQDELIETYKCSIIDIHHAGKDIGRGGRGNSVQEDWVDAYVEMKKLSGNGEPLKVRVTPKLLRHAELPPDPIELIMDDHYQFKLAEPLPIEETVEGQVATYIEKQKGQTVTPKELFAQGIGSNTSVYQALEVLAQAGKINKIGRGQYTWLI